MRLSVEYEGVVLADSAEAQPTERGLFVPLPAPMPVGTRLRLKDGETARERTAEVARIRETGEPGVFLLAPGGAPLSFVEAARAATPAPAETAAAGPAPDETAPSETAPDAGERAEEGNGANGEADKKDDGKKRRRRKK